MKFLLTVFLTVSGSLLYGQNTLPAADVAIVFRDVNVVSMRNDRILEHQSVITNGGRIIAIGPVDKIRYDSDAVVVDGRGKYLLPGLAEMHAHVPPSDDIESIREILMLFALNGITTIRGMLGHPSHLQVRQALRNGEIIGPNFYASGPSFNGMSVRSPEEGAAMVRRQKEAGYDYLKLHPGLTREKFDAIAVTAKEVGIPFVGHVSSGVGVWHAIESGYSSIDHLDGFVEGLVPGSKPMHDQETGLFGMYVADKVDRARIPELMEALKNNKVWVVPTQSLAERWFNPDYTAEDFQNDPYKSFMSQEIITQWISSKKDLQSNARYNKEELENFIRLRRELILACQKNGVGLLLGCDAPQVFNVPGFSTHQELQYLVLAGLTPYQALRTGTVNVARYLGKNDSGIIEEGAVSDLVLLEGNPLQDISNTGKIAGVMVGDLWMDRDFITAELNKLEKQ